VSTALEHFTISKQPPAPATGDDDTHTDDDVEDGEVVEISTHTTGDAGIIDAPDDMNVDQPPFVESLIHCCQHHPHCHFQTLVTHPTHSH
jgi:hypothetical protein